MTIDEALDLVVARTGHHRYRELCRGSEEWRRLVLELARPPAFPWLALPRVLAGTGAGPDCGCSQGRA